MPKAKNGIQNTSINDPQQNISVKITFYFNILKQSILDFFWELPYYKFHDKNFKKKKKKTKKNFSLRLIQKPTDKLYVELNWGYVEV